MEEVKRTELEKKIDILEDDIADISPEILRLLLKDKTTKKNILWCTKDYEAYGYEFNERAEMKVELITGVYFNVIQPRAAKSKEVQERRIRKRAEVFTPSWICNEQNNQVDEAWFGKPDVFNTPDGTYWITAKDKIQFDGKKTWKKYVDAKRLEITCGEAPYLICNILKKYIQPNKFIDKYNVASPEANSNGRFGERLTVGELLSPEEGATDTFISLGAFDTKFEALALQKYMKTKFFRALLGVKKVTQHCPPMVWEMIPCQEFSENSDIDWSKSIHEIDLLLYKKYGLSDEEIAFIESKVKPMDGTSYYESMLKTNYQDIVSALLKKYGSAKHNYFKDTACKIKNPLVTRTNEGLFCHHIDEDKAIMLCNDKFAVNNPFEYQKADRLVYCNLLEHLLLHVKIAENPSPDANENELPGIGGAINFICKDLNDIYSGKKFSDEWRKNVADKVKDNFDDYIIILRYLWNIVEKNPVYKAIITKEMLCVGWDGKVVKEVMNALNANE